MVFTFSLLTGNPRSPMCSCTWRRRLLCMADVSSPRRTAASTSTWAPVHAVAVALTEWPSTSGGLFDRLGDLLLHHARVVAKVPFSILTRRGVAA